VARWSLHPPEEQKFRVRISAGCKGFREKHTLAGFDPGIFCSVGGRDDHNATPPGHHLAFTAYSMASYSQTRENVFSRGRCYDHNFLRFFGEKIGVFLKNQCYD
jgi:hypothetical protein